MRDGSRQRRRARSSAPLVVEAAELEAESTRLRSLQAAYEREQRTLRAIVNDGELSIANHDRRLTSLDDLIRTKRFAARPKDLEDIRLLEILRSAEGA